MTTKSALGKDINGANTFTIAPSVNMKSLLLEIADAASFTVPTEFKFYDVYFSMQPGLIVWVSYDGEDAEYPTTGSFVDTNSEMNPTGRRVPGGSSISCVTPNTTAFISVIMYGIP